MFDANFIPSTSVRLDPYFDAVLPFDLAGDLRLLRFDESKEVITDGEPVFVFWVFRVRGVEVIIEPMFRSESGEYHPVFFPHNLHPPFGAYGVRFLCTHGRNTPFYFACLSIVSFPRIQRTSGKTHPARTESALSA
jgi:hypothetical protein